MEGFLQVNSSSHLTESPTNSFIADEVASICPLITPSPPTNDLINPGSESQPSFTIGEELATILQQVQDNEKGAGDSASSSSSALAEPSCAQLLNHRNNTYHIVKDEQSATEETAGKVQPLQLTFRNHPENYFFMSWNWPVIRKVSLGLFLSGLVAMVGLVITMISNLPNTCNPQTEWYQGTVMYEVFPASFYDSDQDMICDFKGLYQKADYIKSLGVKSVRLNSIFQTQHYPEDYKNVTSLIDVAPQLGRLSEFEQLTKRLHSMNISILLDLPIFPVMKQLVQKKPTHLNNSNMGPVVEFSRTDLVEEALIYWTRKSVDGFYLKGLEYFVDDPSLGQALRRWKKTVGPDRPLIVSESVISSVPSEILNTVLNNVDLVDIKLEVEKGSSAVTKQLNTIQNGTMFSRRGLPWIMWSLGDETTARLANVLPYRNATLGAILLQLMLPGTVSIFYGDEIGLQQILDPEGDRRDLQHLHQLASMVWSGGQKKVLGWMHGKKTATNFEQVEVIARMVDLRKTSPSIYINSVYKEGDNKPNAEVKYSRSDLLVMQRWYPRRKSYVVASNLGNSTITADLSTILYSGVIKIGPGDDSKSESVSFKNISLCPWESVIIELH